jgi:hypothetical protein
MPSAKKRHQLNKNEQLRGITKALRSKRTPPWLKHSMRKYANRLRTEIARGQGSQ